MKLKVLSACLITGIIAGTLAVTDINLDAASSQNYGQGYTAELLKYNNGLYIKVCEMKNIIGVVIDITFENSIEGAITHFLDIPTEVQKSAKASKNVLTLTLNNTTKLSSTDELEVAFLEFKDINAVKEIKIHRIHPAYSNTSTDHQFEQKINEDYKIPTQIELPQQGHFPGTATTLPSIELPQQGHFPGTGTVIIPPDIEMPKEGHFPGTTPVPTPDIELPQQGHFPGTGVVLPNPNLPTPEVIPDSDDFELPKPGGPNIMPEVDYNPNIEGFELTNVSTSGRITTAMIEVDNNNIYSGYSVTEIPDDILEEAINNVLVEAKERRTIPRLAIKVDSSDQFDKVIIKLNTSELAKLDYNEDSIFELETDIGSVMLDMDAIQSVVSHAHNRDIEISIADEDTMIITEKQEKSIGRSSAYQVEITNEAGEELEKVYSDLEITVKYSLPSGHSKYQVEAHQVDEDGKLDILESKYYSSSQKLVIDSDELDPFIIYSE